MPDTIGEITVPEIAASGTFPIVSDYGYGMAEAPDVAVHRFGSADAKIEQRFLLGNGAKRFTVHRAGLSDAQRLALIAFWENQYGPFGAFTYNAPNDSGAGTTAYTCRFANEPLSFDHLTDAITSFGVTLIEIPAAAPVYVLNATQTRFPSGGLPAALLSQVQEMIPLVKIQPKEAGYPAIAVSDRRCFVTEPGPAGLSSVGTAVTSVAHGMIVGDYVVLAGGAQAGERRRCTVIGTNSFTIASAFSVDQGAGTAWNRDQLYQARLLRFEGISQALGNEADQAQFVFGNADRVMRDLVNDVDLYRAGLEFSLFHVGTGIKLDLWAGDVVDWKSDAGPEFGLTAADGIYELNLPYPTRRVSRTCPKQFDDGAACPYTAQGSLDLVHFAAADATKCDKGYSTANGCLAHTMGRYHGGLVVEPQGVRVKDNSTGTWGFGRSTLTSVSLVQDSIYDEIVPEIYTDDAMPVPCKIAAGRDEGEFYEALGIVGEGPLGSYGSGHTLDDQIHHGPGALGLRTYLGSDPADVNDYFSLDQKGDQTGGDWRKVYLAGSTYLKNFAAGTAFVVIRRSDGKGLQLSRPGDHHMQVYVQTGLQGLVWTAPGARSWQVITNPIWIAVNASLKAKGLRLAGYAAQEAVFDVAAAISAGAICDTLADKLVEDAGGPGTETQFRYRGILQEEKPLRDWIQEILMNCLGYYTFSFGKLKLGIRINSSSVQAFTVGNILLGSLMLAPMKPSFNHLTANFADAEFAYAMNTVALYDIDHARLLGTAGGAVFLKSTMNLAGTFTKSQAARLLSVRLREELGGITPAEWKAARKLSYRTTVLALNSEVGMVHSMTHADMPGGAGEFRVTGWRLNPDYSIDVQGRTTTDSMYDLTGKSVV